MTRKTLEVQFTKQLNTIKDQHERIVRQDQLLREAVNEIDNLELSLLSARMFATALMIVTNTESAEFTREELNDIVENKMIGFSNVVDAEGKQIGVKLELKVEEIHETKISDTETSGKRARKPRKRKVDTGADTVQAGIDSNLKPTADERQH